MINIRSYAKTKQNLGQGTSGSGGGSGGTQVIVNNSSVNDWFYFNEEQQAVHCRYTLGSDYDVFAFGLDSSGSSGGGGTCNCSVVDNLLSDSSTACLSANQGRILSEMIGDIPVVDTSALYVQISQNFSRKPVVLYETDGTTGLLGVNANELGYNWQLEDYDFSPYQYLRCYIKMADQSTTSNALTPAMIIELPLDEAALAKSAGDSTALSPKTPCDIYVAGGAACNPSDQNRVFNVLVAVDSTKTKFQVVCENSLYGTAQTNRNTDGRYLYKIEGCYDSMNRAVESDFVETDPVFIASAAHRITFNDLDNYNDASNLRHWHTNSQLIDGITDASINAWNSGGQAAESAHTHSNLQILEGITQTKVQNWDRAFSMAHSHSNLAALNQITSQKIQNWDSYANTISVMQGDITDINERLIDAEDDIDSLNLGLSNVSTNIQNVSSYAADVSTRLNNVSTRLNNVSTRLNNVSTRLKTTNTSVNNLENTVSTLVWVNDYFYIDSSNNVHSRYNFIGDEEISAFGLGQNSGGGSGEGSNILVINNLTSDSSTDALSALQGKILNDRINDLVISGGNHSHDNKAVLDQISQDDLDNWTDASNLKHGHSNKALLDSLTQNKIDKWDGYQTTISVLSGDLSDLNEIVLVNQNNIANISTGLSQANSSIGDISTRLNNVSTRLNNVSTRLNNVSTRLNNVSTRLKTTNTSVNAIETRLTGIDASVTGLEWLNDAFYLDGSNNIHAKRTFVGDDEISAFGLGNSQGSGGSGQSVIVVNNLTSDSSTDALSALQGKILNDRIDDLIISGGNHSHDNLTTLDKITENDLTNWTDASNLKHSHDNLGILDSITENKVNSWDGYGQTIGDIQDTLGDIQDTVSDVSTRLNTTNQNISVLNTSVSDISTRLYNVSTGLNEVSTGLQNASTRINNVSTRLANCSTHLKEVSTRLNNVSTRLSVTNASVNSLEWLNDVFYLDSSNNLHTNKVFIGDDEISAFGLGNSQGSGGQGSNVVVINNLTSNSSTDALSAYQGKVLKGLIDDLVISGGNHSHDNKAILDGITDASVTAWNSAAQASHSHSNLSVLSGITSTKVNKWDGYQTQISTLNSDFTDLNERVMTAENNIANVSSGLITANSSISDISTRLSTVQAYAQNTSTRMSNNLNTINTRITNANNKISDISTRLNTTNVSVGQIRQELDQLKSDFDDLQDTVFDLTWINDWFSVGFDSSGNQILIVNGGLASTRDITAYR